MKEIVSGSNRIYIDPRGIHSVSKNGFSIEVCCNGSNVSHFMNFTTEEDTISMYTAIMIEVEKLQAKPENKY